MAQGCKYEKRSEMSISLEVLAGVQRIISFFFNLARPWVNLQFLSEITNFYGVCVESRYMLSEVCKESWQRRGVAVLPRIYWLHTEGYIAASNSAVKNSPPPTPVIKSHIFAKHCLWQALIASPKQQIRWLGNTAGCLGKVALASRFSACNPVYYEYHFQCFGSSMVFLATFLNNILQWFG